MESVRHSAPLVLPRSALAVLVVAKVPRAKAKIDTLWLKATFEKRCRDLADDGVAPLRSAATASAPGAGRGELLLTERDPTPEGL